MTDMVIIPDPETIRAEYVISNGRVIAQNGQLSVAPRHHCYLHESLNTVKLPRKLNADNFKILVNNDQELKKVRIIDMVTDLVTHEIIKEIPVIEGEIACNKNEKLAKIAAVDRTHEPGKIFTGLISGFGLKSWAMACSAAWDSSCIIVIGVNESDMAIAVNRIHKLKGGIVICENNEIIGELALPVFGIISELPIEDIAEHMGKIKTIIGRLGVNFPDPLLSLIALTGVAIPYLRICEAGLVNLKDGKILKLFPDERDISRI
jgi:adenine deaminase